MIATLAAVAASPASSWTTVDTFIVLVIVAAIVAVTQKKKIQAAIASHSSTPAPAATAPAAAPAPVAAAPAAAPPQASVNVHVNTAPATDPSVPPPAASIAPASVNVHVNAAPAATPVAEDANTWARRTGAVDGQLVADFVNYSATSPLAPDWAAVLGAWKAEPPNISGMNQYEQLVGRMINLGIASDQHNAAFATLQPGQYDISALDIAGWLYLYDNATALELKVGPGIVMQRGINYLQAQGGKNADGTAPVAVLEGHYGLGLAKSSRAVYPYPANGPLRAL
jgi:hypothetical protein